MKLNTILNDLKRQVTLMANNRIETFVIANRGHLKLVALYPNR